ncbi:MAG: DUF3810 domain-containing protein [Anditalea sp.]
MFKNSWTWTILGIIALFVRIVASKFPERTEIIYSRSIFPVIRNLFDISISRLPFPTFYLFLTAVFLFLGVFVYRFRKRIGRKKKFQYSIRSLINFIGMIVFFFLVFWGFNYQRIPISQQLALQPRNLNQEELLQEIWLTKSILSQLRLTITQDTSAIEEVIPYPELEDMVRGEIKANLSLLGLNFTGHPRTKEFYPPGFLRKLGILGIYFPFTGESYIDPTLHPLEKPFTIAHEMAHSYGIANEGEANFIGWVICANSENVLLQYSGQLRLFRYQLNDLYWINREFYHHLLATIDTGIKNDMASIIKNRQEIKPISLELSRMSNDLFLKTQGVEAGVKSYAQLTRLAYAWRNRLKDE